MKPKTRVADNRRARFDIAVEETVEAGIVLTGDEIKSIRASRIQMTGAYVKLMRGGKVSGALPKAVVVGMHLSAAKEPERVRPLLLHAKEIRWLDEVVSAQGKTAVPLEVHFKQGWAKVTIGVGKGRKKYDKRQLLKERAVQRDAEHIIKGG